jgi:AcrR family transcriptional regulator
MGRRRRGTAAASGDGLDPGALILRAAGDLLVTRGLDELTVTEIIAAAGISRPTFYGYFESKHAVVAELARDLIEDNTHREWMHWLASSEASTVDEMRRRWHDTIVRWQENSPILRAAAQGWRSHNTAFRGWEAAFDKYTASVEDHINRARAEGQALPGGDAHGLAASLVWMSENAMFLSVTRDDATFNDPDKLAAALTEVWHRSIYGINP